MPTLTINGKEITVEDGMTVLQACEQAGIEVPRFCYHERLSIAGSCRMCLVEMERSPKLIASCAMPAGDGMVIQTNSERVEEARGGVMELLLLNHPLDCPVCDQGGECDLQDQAVSYGRGLGRNIDGRRQVKDKYIGPLVKTVMTRCIQCTRCVRFMDEIAGSPELAGANRGDHLEITPFFEGALKSNLSGNLVDVCPVGALTNAQYAFRARPWELGHTPSIDIMDAVGSNINLDTRSGEVLRITPRLNEDVNEEWLADKGRYIVDALKRQRLDRPWVRKDGKLQATSWNEAFEVITAKVKATDSSKQAAISGNLTDAETAYSLKTLLDSLGVNNRDCRQSNFWVDINNPASWRFNSSIAAIEDADFILLIGTNPAKEAPVLNARIRKRYLRDGLTVALIGADNELTYKKDYLGNDITVLKDIALGSHSLSDKLKNSKNPMIILGEAAMQRSDAPAIAHLAQKILNEHDGIRSDWNGYNILHNNTGTITALEAGFIPENGGKTTTEILTAAQNNEIEIVWLFGADEIDTKALENSFVIYIGHHGDRSAAIADVILPAVAWSEKSSIYINTEGRAQMTFAATAPLGEAKEDWAILRAISEKLEVTFPWHDLSGLREHIAEYSDIFANIGDCVSAEWKGFGQEGELLSDAFGNIIDNYYMTNSISRNSSTMALATKEIEGA
ncbi:MAG: NADH-quinone oxidoreductase subunit NuoG [Alphaproteobacteria bacterium]